MDVRTAKSKIGKALRTWRANKTMKELAWRYKFTGGVGRFTTSWCFLSQFISSNVYVLQTYVHSFAKSIRLCQQPLFKGACMALFRRIEYLTRRALVKAQQLPGDMQLLERGPAVVYCLLIHRFR